MDASLLNPVLDIASRYGRGEAISGATCDRLIQSLTEADLSALAHCYRWITDHDLTVTLIEMTLSSTQPALSLWFLFVLFERLGARGIEPFSDQRAWLLEYVRPRLDWSSLPEALGYLIPYAETYGWIQGDDAVERFIDRMASDERQELANLAERMRKDSARIWEYISAEDPMTAEAVRVFALLDLVEYLPPIGYRE